MPRKLAPLLQPARYKGAHGGRGGAKSHFFAEQLVLRCRSRKTRAVCIREVQNSIKESVRQLIVDKIQKHGLEGDPAEGGFEILEGEIRTPYGGLIIFKGMQAYNAANIKSLEDYDVAWVEEAQTLSAVSLRMLRPTIRKDGSEIWFSWNPRHDTDPVDAFLRGAGRPASSIVIEVNWQDNPWFPQTLHDEMREDYARDPEMADHVWGGGYEIVSEGAYYAKLIAQAEKSGRIGDYPYDPRLKVHTSWDLGVDDYTAVWFWQEDGQTANVIDYYEVSGDGADKIIATCMPEVFNPPPWDENWISWTSDMALAELQRDEPFEYGSAYLPHDIRMREWGAGARSRVETIKQLGVKNVVKGSATDPDDRIAATRALLPRVTFNNTQRVQLGIKRLRRYSRKFNDTLQTYQGPLHDDNSHGADAFGEFAVNRRIEMPKPIRPKATGGDVTYEAVSSGRIQANASIREIIEAKRRKRIAEAE